MHWNVIAVFQMILRQNYNPVDPFCVRNLTPKLMYSGCYSTTAL